MQRDGGKANRWELDIETERSDFDDEGVEEDESKLRRQNKRK